MRRAAVILTILAATVLAACTHDTRTTSPADRADPTEPGPHQVATAEYHLGDTAFRPPNFGSPVELTGVVHYPADLTTDEAHPLVLFLHGAWSGCGGGTAAERAAGRWPCGKGPRPIPSYRGYDYLGEHLASRGYIAVSIGANGINAAESGDGYAARAALINKHLRLWQQLSTTGRSPLARKLVDPESGKAVEVDFRHRVDLTNVGTVGHSRGGQGVMQHASDSGRKDWPTGVQVKAVVGIAPSVNGGGPALVTTVPLMTMIGTCDGAIMPYTEAEAYLEAARGKSRSRDEAITVPGANHNFFNTIWSPSSGQPFATDDAPATAPNTCTTNEAESVDVAKLTESEQRRVALAYVTAYFDHFLRHDAAADAVLTGEQRLDGLPLVDIKIAEPR